ncbi:acetyl-CoA carboxylase carboxyltransferase subunit beta [Philodulcilactobacillus myokoensis]|nr:acetyl-CoA carboxylase carboxyltransferase subunit beta [Philodulcilactobacillus myokoensis]
MSQIPDHIWVKCPICKKTFYRRELGPYRECPYCHFGFRIGAKKRIQMICDEFTSVDDDLKAPKRFDDPKYVQKLAKVRKVTGLNEGVLTGIGEIDGQKCGIGVMDWRFIMGSLGTATGERITRLFEKSTEKHLPVVLFTASGGARMQEGISSLMQMAKVSQAVNDHAQHGLLYISVLTDPTTGGVTASFASQGDILLSEPHTLIGFAGRRVIERTIQQIPPKNFQRAETLLKNGFLDKIVNRSEMKSVLAKLLAWN